MANPIERIDILGQAVGVLEQAWDLSYEDPFKVTKYRGAVILDIGRDITIIYSRNKPSNVRTVVASPDVSDEVLGATRSWFDSAVAFNAAGSTKEEKGILFARMDRLRDVLERNGRGDVARFGDHHFSNLPGIKSRRNRKI